MSKMNFFVTAKGELSYEVTPPVVNFTDDAIAMALIQISNTLKRIHADLGAIDKDLDTES